MIHHVYEREAFHLFLEEKDAEVLAGDRVRGEVKDVVMH